MKTAFSRWLRGSIRARIVTLFLALLVVVQLASFSAISAGLAHHAHDVLPERLAAGEQVLATLVDQRAQKLTEAARVLAADYGFRSALLAGDQETIASVLENHGERIGATEAALFGADLGWRAGSGTLQRQLAPSAARLAQRAAAAGGASEIALIGAKPHQLVLVPMKAPVLVGWVLMGFPLDDSLHGDMRRLAALDLTLLARDSANSGWRPVLTSLTAAQAATLAAQTWTAGGPAVQGMRAVQSAGEELGVHARFLSTQDAAAEPGGALLALVSLSIDAAVKPPRELQVGLLMITLASFALAFAGSVFTARRVAAPLNELARSAERLGRGDLDTPLEGQQREDEIGALAQAFENMRANVADKQHQIMRLAYWDALTGLPNRAQFRDELARAIEKAGQRGTQVAVIMLDLDRFKHVNDVLGIRAGDELLKVVAERLAQQMVRGDDLVARLGSDEFAVLLREADLVLADSVAQRIARSFDAPLPLDNHNIDMSAGIGYAGWPDHAPDAEMLLGRAEVAMVAAKRRNHGPQPYDPVIDAASAQTLSLLGELRRAVERNELRLFLQPKLALASGAVVGAESLLRWQHPTRGMVPPGDFIPFAEQTGVIRSLTRWVFEASAAQWLDLHKHGIALTLSVNLSTGDLLDQDLPRKFDEALARHGVPAEAFCLEITESAIMDDPQRALGTLNRLATMGFRLSIDDFGTGYSSLAYLKRLPVDELKIDRSFVMAMERDTDDAKIVRSTVDLAHNLGLTVVAEGVETARAWEMLRELDCDEAQGYHMGRPMPAGEFLKWTAGWTARQKPGVLAGVKVLH